MRLKILSLWQPHATLCVTPSIHNPGVPAKPVETRSWSTEHRGWLGVHAAKKKDPLYRSLCDDQVFKQYIPDFSALPFGEIIGMVEISGCHGTQSLGLNSFIEFVSNEDSARMEEIREFGDFSEGRYGFTISDFVKFTVPIKQSGAQGFWYHEMQNFIGERVRLPSEYGIVLDYNPGAEDGFHYLVKSDSTDKKDWWSKNAFSIVHSQRKQSA